MRTDDGHLGKGVGRKVLEHIVATAKARGYERLSLETGSGPAFEAARGLYESAGFERTGPCDTYEDSDFSQYFTCSLG